MPYTKLKNKHRVGKVVGKRSNKADGGRPNDSERVQPCCYTAEQNELLNKINNQLNDLDGEISTRVIKRDEILKKTKDLVQLGIDSAMASIAARKKAKEDADAAAALVVPHPG